MAYHWSGRHSHVRQDIWPIIGVVVIAMSDKTYGLSLVVIAMSDKTYGLSLVVIAMSDKTYDLSLVVSHDRMIVRFTYAIIIYDEKLSS